MKALSIQQPWSWLIVHGHKSIENRSWSSTYRGPLLIHAGKRLDTEGLAWVRRHFPRLELPRTYDFGGIVGSVHMIGCVSTDASPWFFGPFGFVFTTPTPLPFRALRGQLGFFEVPDA